MSTKKKTLYIAPKSGIYIYIYSKASLRDSNTFKSTPYSHFLQPTIIPNPFRDHQNYFKKAQRIAYLNQKIVKDDDIRGVEVIRVFQFLLSLIDLYS